MFFLLVVTYAETHNFMQGQTGSLNLKTGHINEEDKNPWQKTPELPSVAKNVCSNIGFRDSRRFIKDAYY